MWSELSELEQCGKVFTALYTTICAKFDASYASYWVDSESYADKAIMNHQWFVSDVQEKHDSKVVQEKEAELNQKAQETLNHHAAVLQQQAQQMATELAQKMFNDHMAAQQGNDGKDVDM